jgi:chemotaxis protein MotB
MGLNPDLLEESDQPEEGSPAWMATYSDLATLLLTFFVLLLSFANLDAKQFHDALGSVRNAFGVTHRDPGRYEARSNTIVEIGSHGGKVALRQSSPLRAVSEAVERRGLKDLVEVTAEERGIVLRMRDQVLFDVGSDEVLSGGVPILEKVAALANEFEGPLAVEGHTDDRPIHSSKFRSNWELSALRATAVLRHLLSHGVARERLGIAGYADTKALASNNTDSGRAKNRRVEFIFAYEGLK